MKQLAFLSGQREDRHEGEQDDRHREEHRPADESCRFEHRLPDAPSVAWIDAALLDVAERVFGHDDPRVHEHADRDRDPRETHDVRGDAGVIHAQEGQQHRERQRNRDDEDGAQVHQEQHVREGDQRNLLEERMPERVHGLLDERRSVVERNDRHARRQSRLDLRDPRFDRIDHRLGVDPAACDHDPADRFMRALHQRGHAERVTDLHVRDLLDVDRHAVRRADHNPLHIVDGCDQADAADDQPGAVRFEDVAADIQVAVADGGDDRTQRQVVGAEPIRIDVDLVLLNVAPNRRDFGDAGNGIELVPNEPVLKRAQVSQRQRGAFDGVPEDVARRPSRLARGSA